MNIGGVVPLIVATTGAALIGCVADRLKPRDAARLSAMSILSVLGAAAATSLTLTLTYLAHLPLAGGRFAWCREALSMHQAPPTLVGLTALGVTGVGTVRLFRVLERWRAERGIDQGFLHILVSDQPFAYAEPGPQGGIILSSALLTILDSTERRVVVAHERSHLEHRHDRYLLLAILADPIPGLHQVANQLRLAVERWADEDAAAEIGDRKLVARTVARAALATAPSPRHLLAATGSHVPTRVRALAAPATDASIWTAPAATFCLTALLASILQLHHLVPLLGTLSRH